VVGDVGCRVSGSWAARGKLKTQYITSILLTAGRNPTIGTDPFPLAERTAPGYYQGHLWQGLR